VSLLAPNAAVYALAQIGVVAALATFGAVSVVVITEGCRWPRAPAARDSSGSRRARRGLVIALLAFAVEVLGSWRWLWVLPIASVLCLPWLRRALPETGRFELARDLGQVQTSRMLELVRSRYRVRALGVLIAAFLGNAANVAALTGACSTCSTT
jgi:hypothetical protein